MNVARLWRECHRNKTRFIEHHQIWLNQRLDINEIPSTSKALDSTPSRGRPRKCFEEASVKTKKRRVSELLTKPIEELHFAVQRYEVR